MLVVGAMVGQHCQLIAKFLMIEASIPEGFVLTMQNCVPSVQVVHSPKLASFDAALQVIPAES